MKNRHEISLITGIPEDDILNVYSYGSEVYGTWTPKSDQDFIIVRSGEHETSEIRKENIDVTIYDAKHFQAKVDSHYISNLECLWLPIHLKYESHSFKFVLDLAKLRRSISESCNISYDKCKKRLIPDNPFADPYSAKKSLWHALRIADFGWQIAGSGKINHYDSVNRHRDKILDMPDDWIIIKEKYQPLYNCLMSEFRKVAPK